MSQRWRARCQIRARPWRGSVVRVVIEVGGGGGGGGGGVDGGLLKGLWDGLGVVL